MSIDVTYIVVSVVALLIGAYIGFKIGRTVEKHKMMRKMALTVDGEIHQAMHYLVADEERERTARIRRKEQKLSNVTPANSQARRVVERRKP
jgi:hypothetical protein